MATEFYKSIPESIKGKLEEYNYKYPLTLELGLNKVKNLGDAFYFSDTPEGREFWIRQADNNTFPQWSDELNRFIDPPQVNTITVNADEYQAMREVMVHTLKMQLKIFPIEFVQKVAKSMGIGINEITN